MSPFATADTITVAIADGDAVRRAALSAATLADPRLALVGESRTGRDVLDLVERCAPDVLAMGTEMPEMDGLTTLRVLRGRSSVRVIVVADEPEVECMLDALSLGARGYLAADDLRGLSGGGLARHLIALWDGDEGVLAIGEIPGSAGELRCTRVTVPRGRASGLGRLLRAGRDALGDAVHMRMDAPGWLVDPLARRLHRSTPWRVVAAREGDALARGHVLISTADDALVAMPSGSRLRLVREATGAPHGAPDASSHRTPVSGTSAVGPLPKWAT